MGFLMSKRDGAALSLALADGGAVEVFDASGSAALARVLTPNTPPTTFSVTPTTTAKLLAVVDITPKSSGLVLVSATFSIVGTAADTPSILMSFLEGLTAVTGGTLVSPALTVAPTSTTPDVTSTGNPVIAIADTTSVILGANTAALTFASVPLQLAVGQRACVAFLGASNAAEGNPWQVSLALSAVEQP